MSKIFIGVFAIITFLNISAKAQNCAVTFNDSTAFCDAYFYGTPLNAGNGINWTWNFGDGNVGTGQYPVHTYAQNGAYYVCVTIFSANGGAACQAIYCDSVNILGCGPQNGCNADFNYSAANCTVNFTDISQPTPTNWWWDFGDGGSSMLQSPLNTYLQSGLYTVCLISYDSLINCYDTICKQVTVNCGVGVDESYTGEIILGIYPNPFNLITTIAYSLQQKSAVQLEIIDVLGNKVIQLENEVKVSGNYQVVLNADKLSSGIYFVKMTIDGNTVKQKIVLKK